MAAVSLDPRSLCVPPCEHSDCAATRAQAAAACGICREAIGYDRPFYYGNSDPAPVHAACFDGEPVPDCHKCGRHLFAGYRFGPEGEPLPTCRDCMADLDATTRKD